MPLLDGLQVVRSKIHGYGVVATRLGIYALCVRRRHIGKHLDFRADQAERFCVSGPDGPPER